MLQTANTFLVEQGLARVVGRLALLRRQLRGRLLVQGAARWLWLLLAIALIDFALDWTFHFDQPQRAVLLFAVISLLGWAAYRWIIAPLAAPVSDDSLALAIEELQPDLEQRLVSGLQLARCRDPQAQGMSPALVRRAVAEASQLAEALPLDALLDQRRYRQSAGLLAVAGLLLMAIGIGSALASPLNIWFRRNLLVSTATWPTNTVLVMDRLGEDGALVFPRGQSWTQAVTVADSSREVPGNVSLDVRERGQQTSVVMRRVSHRRFEASFREVTEPLELRARGGDAVTPWIPVKLVDPPDLVAARLVVTPPGYTGTPPEAQPAGQKSYALLPGSGLHIEATATGAVSQAEVVFAGRPLVAREQSAPVVNGSLSFVRDRGALVVDIEPGELVAGDFRFELRDEFGFTSSRAWGFTVVARLDAPPDVQVELSGIGGVVTSAARIPLHCRASDDFGLVVVSGHVRGGAAAEAEPVAHEIELAGANERLAQMLAQSKAFARELAFHETLDLAPLELSPGSGVQLFVEAVDNDDVRGPNKGRSSEITLRVVTDSDFLADLLRREKLVRQELAAVIKEQFELATQTRAMAAALDGDEALSVEQSSELAVWQRRQSQVGDRAAGVADRLQDMAEEIVNNRLEEPGGRMHARLSKQIAEPLTAIAHTALPAAADRLADARLSREVGRQRTILEETALQQTAVAQQMQAILQEMVQAEGFQEAVQLLYEIERAQTEVHEQTRQALEERIRGILEGTKSRP